MLRPVVNRREPSSTWFAELYLSVGPQQIGDTGDSSFQAMFGWDWLLATNRQDGRLRLYREASLGDWVEVEVPGHPVVGQVMPAGARRFSLAFDQAARPAVAFEVGGTIFITRFDPLTGGYVQNVSVPGVDPVLMLDAIWHGSIGGSDVLLFHLSADRTQVLARVQSDIWSTPTVLHTYGSAVILDRVTPLPFRYQLLLSDAGGAVLDDALVSSFYPLSFEDRVAAAGLPPLSGAYVDAVINAGDFTDDVAVTGLPPLSGVYREVIELLEFGPDDVSATGLPPTGGTYAPAVEYLEPIQDDLEVTGLPPSGGDYVLVTVNLLPLDDEVEVTGLPPSGGTYEAA